MNNKIDKPLNENEIKLLSQYHSAINFMAFYGTIENYEKHKDIWLYWHGIWVDTGLDLNSKYNLKIPLELSFFREQCMNY